MTKLYENSFRAVNIALANEFAEVCAELSLDPMEVTRAAATKPYGYMPFYPGPGVGGHCIPCDPHYLIWQLRASGGGAPLVNSAGVPWSAAYIDTIGEPTADLRSNIAAEARAKIVYERLINCTDDAGVKEALGFLMTREIAHQVSFEKALYAIQPNFPPGKLPGKPEFTDVYVNTSQGDGDMRGPWNSDDNFRYVSEAEEFIAMDGGDGMPAVQLSDQEREILQALKQRTRSDPEVNPKTGAELGMNGGPRTASRRQERNQT